MFSLGCEYVAFILLPLLLLHLLTVQIKNTVCQPDCASPWFTFSADPHNVGFGLTLKVRPTLCEYLVKYRIICVKCL